MIRSTTVRESMTVQLITIAPSAQLHEAVELLLHNRVSGLPVVGDDGDLLGIVTEQDCLRAAHGSDYFGERGGTVADAMTRELTCIDPDDDIMTAIDVFLHNSFRRLPVTSAGRLVGLLSRRDALRALQLAT